MRQHKLLVAKCFEKLEEKVTDGDGNHLLRVTYSPLMKQRDILAPI